MSCGVKWESFAILCERKQNSETLIRFIVMNYYMEKSQSSVKIRKLMFKTLVLDTEIWLNVGFPPHYMEISYISVLLWDTRLHQFALAFTR